MLMNEMMDHFPFGFMHVNVNGEILYANKTCEKLLHIDSDMITKNRILSIIPNSNIIATIKKGIKASVNDIRSKVLLLEMSNMDGVNGTILLFDEEHYQTFIRYFESIKEANQDLESLMNLSGELVTITDAAGTILRVSAQCESMMGVKEHELIGKSVYHLQGHGVVNSSSTIKVMKTKRKCELTQVTKSGKRLFVRGYPIFNEQGKLKKVVNLSKDISEEYNLKKQLTETKELIDYYHHELTKIYSDDKEFTTRSTAMQEIYNLVTRIADIDVTVLLLGESGVGKDVIARMIHQLSSRKSGPFITINCGAIPENLMESELFGYAKGTFTGANKEGKTGLFLAANKGTLFLDEIGELPYRLQVKLLRVLQEKQITPLGQTTSLEVDVRIITATNRNLEIMVEEGNFRKDLYYRLNVVPINIPPLRERKKDIPLLIDYFLKKYNEKYNEVKTISEQARHVLMKCDWEGNVRELENMIERLIVTSPTNQIQVQHLPKNKMNNITNHVFEQIPLATLIDEYEKRILTETVENSRSLKEVSEKLGVHLSTISRKVRKYNINVAKMQ